MLKLENNVHVVNKVGVCISEFVDITRQCGLKEHFMCNFSMFIFIFVINYAIYSRLFEEEKKEIAYN